MSAFTTTETGWVHRNTRQSYNYTPTLLSSQPVNDSNLRVLDSIIVVSLESNHPNFNIFCSGNLHSKTISPGEITDSDPSINGSVAKRLFSTPIGLNQIDVHVFICGPTSFVLFEGNMSPTIEFHTSDEIGLSREELQSDHNSI